MNKTFLFSSIFIVMLLGCNNKVFSQLFYDSFESLDMSATNSDGFSWTSSVRTSIVTQHPVDGNVVVFNGNSIYNIVNDGRNWAARDGDYSLRFRYPAGQDWSEQRFDLGSAYPELWVSFWLRVPTNFSHGAGSPTNHKLFAIWMDGYEIHGDGPTVTWNFWNDGNNGSNITVSYSDGGFGGNGPQVQSTPFISYPTDQGRWMNVAFRVKASTNTTSNNGVIEMWRRWEGETVHSQLHLLTDADIAIPTGGPEGWKAGYLVGWANAPYDNDTEWLLDNFTVSETSLLDSSLSTNEETFNNSILISPNPTSNTFTIDLGNDILKETIIYNQLGQQIKEVTTSEVDISSLSKGIYVVKVTSQNGKTTTKKVIKN